MFIYDVSKDGFESSDFKMTANDSRRMLHTIYGIFTLSGLSIFYHFYTRENFRILIIDLDINLEHFSNDCL